MEIRHLSNGVQIHRIDGYGFTTYDVYEPYSGHSTITFEEGVKLGRIGTRSLPADLDALKPWSHEREDAVRAWHAAQYEEAYGLIDQAYPHNWGRRSMGMIHE
jgi:hypothetical protein